MYFNQICTVHHLALFSSEYPAADASHPVH
jgi:hypothetical protein